MFRRLITVLAVCLMAVVGFTTATASATPAPAAPVSAQSIPDSDISQTTVHSRAYRTGNGAGLEFHGVLQAKGAGQCYKAQQLTSQGLWVDDGFFQNNVMVPVTHCSSDSSDYETWTIVFGLGTRGIRFVRTAGGGTNIGTHCNTATTCREMYVDTNPALLRAAPVAWYSGGVSALAIPDSDISQNTVHSTAYRVGNGDSLAFYGALQAKGCHDCTNPVCYRMERLTANGDWVWSGFRDATTNVVLAPPKHCSFNTAEYVDWKITDGLTVRGIRTFRYDAGGANVATHCNTATTCRNMYQGTLAGIRQAAFTLAA